MKPSLSRIGWALLCCAAAAFALAPATQHPAAHRKSNATDLLLPEPKGKTGQPTLAPEPNSPVKKAAVPNSPSPNPTEKPGLRPQNAIAQHPVPRNFEKAQKQFVASAGSLRDARDRIQTTLNAATEQIRNLHGQAAALNPKIARLNQLLGEVTGLQRQAATVQETLLEQVRNGVELDKSDISFAEKKTKALVDLANIDADQADKIARNINDPVVASAGAGGAVAVPQAPVAHAALPGIAPAPAPVPVPTPAPAPAPVVAPPDPAAAPPENANASANAAAANPAPATPPDPAASDADPEELWFSKLRNGRLHYSIPATMNWRVASTLTVTIDGEKAPSAQLPNETAQAPIKVARFMTVQPSCPDNPDEFTFTPDPGMTPRQYVSADGTTTWQWSVVPKYTAANQKIKIQAWVIYSDKDGIERELPVYNAAVNVRVPGFSECVKRLIEGRADYWVNYGLPGGAGFVFVSTALIGLIKRRSNKKESAA